MNDDYFRSDEEWRPVVGEPFVYLERWGGAAQVHFRLRGGAVQRTDWLALERARSRALEIARLEVLPLPIAERMDGLPTEIV